MRRRNMYYATGLPGWMRFGYSPGWAGRSASGLGPCAEYLRSGQWPTPQMAAGWQAMQAGQAPFGAGFAPMGPVPDPQQRLQWLQAQAQALSAELESLRQQISELEAE